MKKLCLIGLLIFLALANVSQAVPVPMYVDTYRHPLQDNPYYWDQDRIGGSPPFEIYGNDWLDDGHRLRIWWDWNLGPDGSYSETKLGDVFIYLNTGTIAVALRDHDGNENDGIRQGDIFTPNGYRLSDYYNAIAGWTNEGSVYGQHEIVTAYGTDIGDATILFGIMGIDRYIDIIFTDAIGVGAPGIRVAPTCANDVHQVPEPITLLLLGSGLIGVALLGRRKE